jgi:hypothetical protein
MQTFFVKEKEVSIEPSLRQGEAGKYFSEFFGYIQNIHYLKSLEKLHRLLKREGMTSGTDKAK